MAHRPPLQFNPQHWDRIFPLIAATYLKPLTSLSSSTDDMDVCVADLDRVRALMEPAGKAAYDREMGREQVHIIYRAIDWNKCVIGGSGALRQFTNASWNEADTDIFAEVASASELRTLVDAFMDTMNLRVETPHVVIEKFVELTPDMRRDALQKNGGNNERFHESILATCTLQVPGLAMPVQFVGINTMSHSYGKLSLLDHLNLITDLPAAVQYTAKNGTPLYHVPERALEALRTKRIPSANICASRKTKYEERGYDFY